MGFAVRMVWLARYSIPTAMPPWIPYAALAISPVAVLLSINPVRFSWGYNHQSESMPPTVEENAEKLDRYISPGRSALIVATIIFLIRREHIPASHLGLHLNLWQINAALGILAGFLRLGFQGLIWRALFSNAGALGSGKPKKGPGLVQVLDSFLGPFSEELWIAFCLASMIGTQHSRAESILVTTLVFGALHYPYRLGALAVATMGATSGLLFLWRGSLIPSYLFHFIGNLGALYWMSHGGVSKSTGQRATSS